MYAKKLVISLVLSACRSRAGGEKRVLWVLGLRQESEAEVTQFMRLASNKQYDSNCSL